MSQPQLHPLEISCAAVKEKLDRGDAFYFLDCREPDEYQLVSISGAELLPLSELQQRAGELESHRDEPIVIHCHHGGRSLQLATWLHGQGFPDVKSMAGGIDQWALEIDPSLSRY